MKEKECVESCLDQNEELVSGGGLAGEPQQLRLIPTPTTPSDKLTGPGSVWSRTVTAGPAPLITSPSQVGTFSAVPSD